MPTAKLDTLEPVQTPEGAEVALRVAGPMPRALAWGVDSAIRWSAYAVIAVPATMLGEAGGAVLMLSMFIGEWWYGVFFEVLGRGATPGKRTLGLRVVHADGTPVGWGASVIRNFLMFADFLPPPFGAGIVSCLVSPRFQRLGDRAAGTLVVHVLRERTGTNDSGAAPVAPPIPLQPDEQLALVEFAHRLDAWTPERRVELADLLEPLTDLKGAANVDRVAGMARWLEGRS